MTEVRSLAGRNALITGSVGGLGLAMARKLASAGANIVLHGLDDPEMIKPLGQAIEDEFGVRAAYCRADLREPSAVRAMVQYSGETIGPVHILINNAVVRHFACIEDFPIERWNEALAVNVTAAFLATQMVLPGMRDAQYGRIFNMTSVYGYRGTVNRVDYVTTKTAIQGLTRAIALETAGGPVTCHALMPGSVLTPLWSDRLDQMMTEEGLTRPEAEVRFLDGKQPSGRFVDTDSVADVLMLLCGPAGTDMNGAILPIEGGWLAR
ncbi:SDR family NAD(P)-dependent oxidoreductase [Sphingobium phenoxybenzoativorans]|uniref:SDR family NAD(P)-dependent oxidoreductase n=1 Tax=Sphingobium phenoxybenzoativorans TaxID=1592790 RepID=UPI0008724B5D|nr:SDR family NAD(P)-dependent oxidoreductase [Sphingobium phenoxybenzoativorans]